MNGKFKDEKWMRMNVILGQDPTVALISELKDVWFQNESGV